MLSKSKEMKQNSSFNPSPGSKVMVFSSATTFAVFFYALSSLPSSSSFNLGLKEHSLHHDLAASPIAPATSNSLLSSILSNIFIAVLLTSVTLFYIIKFHFTNQKSHSPIPLKDANNSPLVPLVPNPHWLMGHFRYLANIHLHSYVFHDNASPQGISGLWAIGTPCISVLRGSHARAVLRNSSERDFISAIVRHGRKSLGEESLILIEGGVRWKKQRGVVSKAFRVDVLKGSSPTGNTGNGTSNATNATKEQKEQKEQSTAGGVGGRAAIWECAMNMVNWLSVACEGIDSGMHKAGCRGCNCETNGCVRVEVQEFFKLYTLDVFGKVACGHDFHCIPSVSCNTMEKDDSVNATCNSTTTESKSSDASSTPTVCQCLSMPPEAEAFDYLQNDVASRSRPPGLINPLLQLYWLPTKQNQMYFEKKSVIDGFLGRIMRPQLEALIGEGGGNLRQGTMITHLLRSTIEENYDSYTSSKSHSLDKVGASSCPFASTSMNRTSSSSSIKSLDLKSINKDKVIRDVSKILHTLLLAGYETTSTALSYVMYCLSKHPRCQERCFEESVRLLGPRDRKKVDAAAETEIDDDKLLYCKAVFMESLRLHLPVIFTTRVLTKDLVLNLDEEDDHSNGNKINGARNERNGNAKEKQTKSVTIPKGMRVYIPPSNIHRYEPNFERAEEFLPERWVRWEADSNGVGRWVERDHVKEAQEKLPCTPPSQSNPRITSKYSHENSEADAISAANPQNFFSFSDGARNCVGKRLAVMEGTIAIAALVRELEVGVEDVVGERGEKREFEMIKERKFVTVGPKTMPIVFRKRI